MKEVIDFFDEVNIFYIATCEDDQPRVRPFGHLLYNQGKFYINTGRYKRFYQQVNKNPKVELCSFNKGTWYRIEACVKEEKNEEVVHLFFEKDSVTKKQYEYRMEEFVIFVLERVKIYRCDFSGAKCVYEEKE